MNIISLLCLAYLFVKIILNGIKDRREASSQLKGNESKHRLSFEDIENCYTKNIKVPQTDKLNTSYFIQIYHITTYFLWLGKIKIIKIFKIFVSSYFDISIQAESSFPK